MSSATPSSSELSVTELLSLAVLSGAAMVLSTMDQCTRGPSLTGMLLTNLNLVL
jgi:hypothetical protein